MRPRIAIWVLNIGFLFVGVIWINSVISVCDSLGLHSTGSHIAVGGACASLTALYFTTAALSNKGIDPMFWRP